MTQQRRPSEDRDHRRRRAVRPHADHEHGPDHGLFGDDERGQGGAGLALPPGEPGQVLQCAHLHRGRAGRLNDGAGQRQVEGRDHGPDQRDAGVVQAVGPNGLVSAWSNAVSCIVP